ncbi:MAG TPA: DinB family protein [Feifaniaceae bacterium]|nr:DinB family protein [Feifaniaceae bacterium]
MNESSAAAIIREQTMRALWEVENVVDCIPPGMWDAPYCGMPLYKHVYHMLHSLDQWFVNPRRYTEPNFHIPSLNNLDAATEKALTKEELHSYFLQVSEKVRQYLGTLTDAQLLERPEGSEWTRFTLMLAQHRHLHSHMGMLMGFVIAGTGSWPRVIGLTGEMTERKGPEYM